MYDEERATTRAGNRRTLKMSIMYISLLSSAVSVSPPRSLLCMLLLVCVYDSIYAAGFALEQTCRKTGCLAVAASKAGFLLLLCPTFDVCAIRPQLCRINQREREQSKVANANSNGTQSQCPRDNLNIINASPPTYKIYIK